MGCVASTQATSVTTQPSVTNTQNTGTSIEGSKTLTKQETKMDADIPDNKDLMEQFENKLETLRPERH